MLFIEIVVLLVCMKLALEPIVRMLDCAADDERSATKLSKRLATEAHNDLRTTLLLRRRLR